jgi:hypothetical protein
VLNHLYRFVEESESAVELYFGRWQLGVYNFQGYLRLYLLNNFHIVVEE